MIIHSFITMCFICWTLICFGEKTNPVTVPVYKRYRIGKFVNSFCSESQGVRANMNIYYRKYYLCLNVFASHTKINLIVRNKYTHKNDDTVCFFHILKLIHFFLGSNYLFIISYYYTNNTGCSQSVLNK